jgi:hypothetical protein
MVSMKEDALVRAGAHLAQIYKLSGRNNHYAAKGLL